MKCSKITMIMLPVLWLMGCNSEGAFTIDTSSKPINPPSSPVDEVYAYEANYRANQRGVFEMDLTPYVPALSSSEFALGDIASLVSSDACAILDKTTHSFSIEADEPKVCSYRYNIERTDGKPMTESVSAIAQVMVNFGKDPYITTPNIPINMELNKPITINVIEELAKYNFIVDTNRYKLKSVDFIDTCAIYPNGTYCPDNVFNGGGLGLTDDIFFNEDGTPRFKVTTYLDSNDEIDRNNLTFEIFDSLSLDVEYGTSENLALLHQLTYESDEGDVLAITVIAQMPYSYNSETTIGSIYHDANYPTGVFEVGKEIHENVVSYAHQTDPRLDLIMGWAKFFWGRWKDGAFLYPDIPDAIADHLTFDFNWGADVPITQFKEPGIYYLTVQARDSMMQRYVYNLQYVATSAVGSEFISQVEVFDDYAPITKSLLKLRKNKNIHPITKVIRVYVKDGMARPVAGYEITADIFHQSGTEANTVTFGTPGPYYTNEAGYADIIVIDTESEQARVRLNIESEYGAPTEEVVILNF